jgi:serine protease Do
MDNIIKEYRDVIIQIITPFGSGSGFYLKSHNLIVTNSHVVAGCLEVVIKGTHFPKTVSNVLFSDAKFDIALVAPPAGIELPAEELNQTEVFAGEQILAIGHPLGLTYTATQGIVSKEERIFDGIKYIQIDAAINPGNSGGPLISNDGKIVGINTFIFRDGESLGFAVPVKYINQALSDYEKVKGQFAVRCTSCTNVVTESSLEDGYCSSCGNKIDNKLFHPEPYRAAGVAKTIENIITQLGKDVRLTRMGANSWHVNEGSAVIKIFYDQKTNFIFCDAMLCQLPKENIGPLYEYVLRENNGLENISFSIYNQNIVLGSVIFSDDLTEETGVNLFKTLFEKADFYDDTLINKFAAEAIEVE